MSYSFKRKKFKCLTCKSTFSKLVGPDDTNVNCENCGKTGHEENRKEEEEQIYERKKSHLVDGAYRIVFNQNNQGNFHTKTNIRDKSIENFHGDANFDTSDVPLLESIYRTPNIQKTTKLQTNTINPNNINRNRPPSGMNSHQFPHQQNRNSATNPTQSSGTLPKLDSRNGSRQQQNNEINNNGRPPSGQFGRVNQSRGSQRVQEEEVRRSQYNFQPGGFNTRTNQNQNMNQQPNYHANNQQQQRQQQQQQREPRMNSQGPRQPFHQEYSSTTNNANQEQRGPRARSTTIRTSDGRLIQVIQMPLADFGGIQNMQFGASMGMPGGAPIFMMRRGGPGADNIPPQDERIENMIGNLLRNFSDLFSGHEFLRMNAMFQGFSPDLFMSNFNQNFTSDVDFFEMARRMSEQEAQERARKKRAKGDSVKKLPVVKIETKHCKKNASSGELEAPTCTVCCENIAIGMKGMFMPCGHIYHPDCLNPWLQEHNTCPVCRFELPTEEL